MARIGRATFSKSGLTIDYGGLEFIRIRGYKANDLEVNSNAEYWISGPPRDGADRLYGERIPIEIDDDIREEYWRDIREQPERINDRSSF